MKKLKYDVSIIVAVYNNEQYLNDCIESVLNQTYELEKIQLILVNDGSADNSLKICKEYAKKHENILVIDQQNQGVSAARNAGLKVAEGKYIMILDSDDRLSNNTVEYLIVFFDEHYDEVDMVTYPMLCIAPKGNYFNFRFYQYKKGEGIYDLDENPNVIQSGVNIIFKNDRNNVIYYNTSMKFSEDEDFNTKIVMRKRKIGFCTKARYLYNKMNENSATRIITNPLYCFESIMQYYEDLINEYRLIYGIIPKYIQALFLNNLSWRIKSDELYPYYLEEEQYNEAVERIINLLKNIDNDVIINMPNLRIYHKIFLLKLKQANLKLNFLENKRYQIIADNDVVLEAKNITISINRFKVKNNQISILAFIRTPIFEIGNYYPEVQLEYIDKKNKKNIKKIDKYFISNKSFYATKMKTNMFYGFEIKLNKNKIKDFKFTIKLDGHKVNTKIDFSRFCPFCERLKRYEIVSGRKIITYDKERKTKYQFCIKNNRRIDLYKFKLKQLEKYYKIKPIAALFRCLARNNKEIWIYMDREKTIDNGYYQFKHDIKKRDKIKRYYIYNDEKNNIKKHFTKKERKYLVKFNTFKHKLLFLKCSKILTAFASSLGDYNPFGIDYDLYKDIMKYELVYLQHGVLHANLLQMYSKEYTEIDKIVVSSQFERDNFINKYNYNKDDIIMSGMPRLQKDIKTKDFTIENKILFAPSWRHYLIGEFCEGKRNLKESAFLKSNYFIKISEFLNSIELAKLLKENNLKMDFQLHPVFKDYENLFHINNEYVNIVKSEDIEKYKILITDFSSYQFDFAKLKRPIIYFVPDMKEFKAGVHTYRELDLPYEKAFGKLTLDKNSLIKEVERIINNQYKDEDVYLEREKAFFIDLNDIQENLYKYLMSEGEKNGKK